MNLADVSAFDVVRLAAAAAFGWGLVRVFFGTLGGALKAIYQAIPPDSPAGRAIGRDDNTPPGPPSA